MYDQLHRENNRTRLSKNWNEGTQSGGKLWSQFQNEIHNISRKWVDFLATLSMNDFIPKSWVWIRCRKPNCSSFSPGKTDGNWLLVEKMRREIDMYRPMRGTRPFGFQRPAFLRWVPASDISRTRGNRFHFQWNESSRFLFSTNSRPRRGGTLCWPEM